LEISVFVVVVVGICSYVIVFSARMLFVLVIVCNIFQS